MFVVVFGIVLCRCFYLVCWGCRFHSLDRESLRAYDGRWFASAGVVYPREVLLPTFVYFVGSVVAYVTGASAILRTIVSQNVDLRLNQETWRMALTLVWPF